MSVLVRGMKMPKYPTAIRIQIEADGSVYQNSDKTGNGWALQKNVTATEVPTPHGDLIDRDAIQYANNTTFDEDYVRRKTIMKMPTIVEAEGIEDG